MKILSLYKRIYIRKRLRQLLVVAGVFLYPIISEGQAAALPNILHKETSSLASPLEYNKSRIVNLKVEFQTKSEKIDHTQSLLREATQDAKRIDSTKQALESEINTTQSEISVLKSKIDEKNRIAALRIVQIGQYAADAAGNAYAPGNCTWYVKSLRPDIPNDWGDAYSWYTNAQADGWQTGTEAKTGAIGVSFGYPLGHVVYIKAWYPDGTMLLTEMNYNGLYSTRDRIANQSDYVYIYSKP